VHFIKLWLVSSLFLTGLANAQEYQDVHPCDELAAHPNDPNRWAIGVEDELIVPGPAVKFCREATESYPDTLRFQFQLARALWAAYQFEEGLDVFLRLENAFEYGPVYAYLGDAYMYGIGGIEADQVLAVSLYQIADEFGFLPASDVLAALNVTAEETRERGDTTKFESEIATVNPAINKSADIEQVTPKQVVATQVPVSPELSFSSARYLEPGIMDGLYHGNFNKVSQGSTKYIKSDIALFYLQGFLGPFSQNVNFLDETNSCIDLYQPALAKHIAFKVARGAPGSEVLFGGDLNAASRQGWEKCSAE